MRIPGWTAPLTLSQLYVDGVPLDDLQALYDYNTKILGGTKWNSPNQFWASPPRNSSSPIREVLDIGISTPAPINHISFQVSKFPCQIDVEWYDPNALTWKPLRHKRTGRPIVISVTESVPARIHENVFDKAHRHPHHRAAGHWQTVEFDTKTVRAARIRLVLARIHNKKTPVNIGNGRPAAYSLAVKDLQYGYEVKGREDVPLTSGANTQIVSEATSFASTTDLLGSNVEFALTEYDANDLLWPAKAAALGTPKDERLGDGEIWRSEPQPFPYAVVSLYVDARTSGGDPQVVDRFFIDTPTTGVGVNLYYSDQEPDLSLGFEARETAIRYPAVQGHGSLVSDANGIFFPNATGFLDLDRAAFQPNDAMPNWTGLKFQPQFDSTSTDDHVIVSTPHIEVRWDGTQQAWTVDVNGQVATHAAPTFVFNQTITLMVVKDVSSAQVIFDDGWATLVNFLPGATRPGFDAPAPLTTGGLPTDTSSPGLDRTRTTRFGAALCDNSANLGTGGYRMLGFVMKQETPSDQDISDWLTTDATTYLLPADISVEVPWDFTHNALVRIHSFFRTVGVSSRNPYGVVGGPASGFEDLVWIPISRDYRLQKGYLQFDPVKAKYFKFEFSSLSPQPYSSYVPMARKVRLFTDETVQTSGGDRLEVPYAGSTKVNMASSSTPMFRDQTRVQYLADPSRAYSGYSPTEALYSTDPGAQQRLAELNPAFRFQPWHRPFSMPRFVQIQKHTYETVKVTHESNIAYFVALSALRMYRVDYSASDDTGAYLITFHDDVGLATSDVLPWTLTQPNGLQAPALNDGQVATTSSVALPSRRNIRGIQFATVQTPAAQILADPDFNDATLKYWQSYGGALIETTSDLTTDIGSTVKITRAPTSSYWDSMEEKGSWDDIEALDPDPNLPTWDDLESPPGSAQFGGIEGSLQSLVQPAAGGRLYVAARVYAPESLSAPLHLQIIDQNGAALAESQMSPRAGGITEWYTGYTLGTAQFDYSAVPTWDQIEASDPSPGLPTWDDLEHTGTWDDVMGGPSDVYTGPVTVRLFQQDPSKDEFYVDNIALYEDPIVWEFSNDDGTNWWPAYDIRNNPDGVLLFPDLVPETLDITSNLNLHWRVSSYRPSVRVSGLFIRPWYSTLQLGVPTRDELNHGGPNISHYDQYPSIYDWAPFKVWDRPIPQDWWFVYRQWLLQGGVPAVQEPVIPPTIVPFLSDAFLYPATPLAPIILTDGLVLSDPVIFADSLIIP